VVFPSIRPLVVGSHSCAESRQESPAIDHELTGDRCIQGAVAMVTLIGRGFEFCTIAFVVVETIRRFFQFCNDLFLLPGVFARPAQSLPQRLDQFIEGAITCLYYKTP